MQNKTKISIIILICVCIIIVCAWCIHQYTQENIVKQNSNETESISTEQLPKDITSKINDNNFAIIEIGGTVLGEYINNKNQSVMFRGNYEELYASIATEQYVSYVYPVNERLVNLSIMQQARAIMNSDKCIITEELQIKNIDQQENSAEYRVFTLSIYGEEALMETYKELGKDFTFNLIGSYMKAALGNADENYIVSEELKVIYSDNTLQLILSCNVGGEKRIVWHVGGLYPIDSWELDKIWSTDVIDTEVLNKAFEKEWTKVQILKQKEI